MYLTYAKWILLGLLILALGVQTIRVANRNTTIAEKDQQILADNGTIEKYQDDQAARKKSQAALEEQVSQCQANAARYRETEGKINYVFHGPKPLKPIPATTDLEVLSREDSSRAADLLNGILAGVR